MASEIIKGKDGFIQLDGTEVKFTGPTREDLTFDITADSYILIVLPKWQDGFIAIMEREPTRDERRIFDPENHKTTIIVPEGSPTDPLIEFMQLFWQEQQPLKEFRHDLEVFVHSQVADGSSFYTQNPGMYVPNPYLVDCSDKYLHDYVVVDIETTGLSDRTDKIIEIGAIRYIDDVEVARFSRLIRPYTARMMTQYSIEEFVLLAGTEGIEYIEDSRITELTGITSEMLVNAPTQWEVAPEFFDFVGNLPVVGHNIVKFDIKFIQRMASAVKIKTSFGHEAFDTLNMASSLVNSTSLSLGSVGLWLGIEGYRNSHRAIDDIEYTAKVFQEMKVSLDHDELMRYRDYDKRLIQPSTFIANPAMVNPAAPGSVFVFTGEMKMRRSEAIQRVMDCGGAVIPSVTKKTNYLVYGEDDGVLPVSKIQRAREYMDAGQDIKIINETDFYRLLSALEQPAKSNPVNFASKIDLGRNQSR